MGYSWISLRAASSDFVSSEPPSPVSEAALFLSFERSMAIRRERDDSGYIGISMPDSMERLRG